MAKATFEAGDWVMVIEDEYDQPLSFGIVTKTPEPDEPWVKAAVRRVDGSMSFMAPGFMREKIRHATAQDIDALHPTIREWADRDKLNREDPPIPDRVSGKSHQVLNDYGIKRFSQLKRASDADLLKLKGVGGKTLTALRQWQASTEEQLCPF